jgi:methylmalonyl-CoA mutase
MEEAGLGRVADPAGGAGYLEALTDGLARAGWAALQAIEAAGGLQRALEAGLVQDAAASARAGREAAYREGALALVGITKFPNPNDERPAMEAVETPAPAPGGLGRMSGPDSRCPPLTPIRWAEPFESRLGSGGA